LNFQSQKKGLPTLAPEARADPLSWLLLRARLLRRVAHRNKSTNELERGISYLSRPLLIVGACPRLGIPMMSVTPGLLG
jgi:hypothetical protein